ncbi:hypothetical protein N9948_00740 [bacterium]|nr:hypothetical protein [bacterium]
MEIPNYKNFKYSLTEEEKDLYKDSFEYEIRRIKYFESFTDEQLREIWSDTTPFITGGRHGGKATGLFAKLKIKIKKGSAINPKIIAALIMDEMKKRGIMGERSYEMTMERLKRRNICG